MTINKAPTRIARMARICRRCKKSAPSAKFVFGKGIKSAQSALENPLGTFGVGKLRKDCGIGCQPHPFNGFEAVLQTASFFFAPGLWPSTI